MRELALAVEDVDGDEDYSELDAGQIQVDHFEAIREVDAQAVACFEATVSQQPSQAIAPGVDVAEGVACALKFERGLIAPGVEGKIEELSEIQKLKVARAAGWLREFAKLPIVKRAIWRAVIEVGFIIFLFYSNLLMGEFARSGKGQTMGLAWAIADIWTPTNFAVALTAALIGYVVFEALRSRF